MSEFVITNNISSCQWIGSHNSDFADRDGLISKMKTNFGEENVIPITNFNTFQLKSLVKDISRLHGIPFEESNEVTKNLDDDVKHKAQGAGENKSLFQLKYDDCMKHSERFRNFIEKYPHVGQHIKVLYKQQKTLGRHAGGVVVIEDASKHMPLIAVRKEIQTPWPEGMHIKSLSPFGIIKFDILGLETLRMIQRAVELILQRHEGIAKPEWKDINEWYQKHISPDAIDEADPKVFDYVFKEKRFAGIFQFTAKHTQKFIHEFDPKNVTDLAIATAIYRPGPLAAKVDKLYIEAKRDPSKIHYDHPAKKKVFESSLGFCVAEGEPVVTPNGNINIENIVPGTKVYSYNEETKNIEIDDVVETRCMGIKDVFEIETENGIMKLTADHVVYTLRGQIKVSDLTLEDEIISLCQKKL